MLNFAYDFPVSPTFALTAGAGLGAGQGNAACSDPAELNSGSATTIAYQLIAGAVWTVAPSVELMP